MVLQKLQHFSRHFQTDIETKHLKHIQSRVHWSNQRKTLSITVLSKVEINKATLELNDFIYSWNIQKRSAYNVKKHNETK